MMETGSESGALGWVLSPAQDLLDAGGTVVCLRFVWTSTVFLPLLTCPPYYEHRTPIVLFSVT